MIHRNQTMLFDADDTLWENNIYFERAITAFISYLDHRVHTEEEVREHLNAVERRTIATQGFGLKSFRHSLVKCFEDLSMDPVSAEKHSRIVSFAQSIAEQEIELLSGVADGLPLLAERHRLLLVTKGDTEEQKDKLARSGMEKYFTAVEVLAEKTTGAYRTLIDTHHLDTKNTWMIGNSPKSDINPALTAGLNAVFVPQDFTWVLEHEAVEKPSPGATLLEVATFRDLLDYF